MMQLSGNKKRSPQAATLRDLRRGEHAILDRIDLPQDDARRLMELGFLPGAPVTVGCSAPGGDPRVFRVDGSEIALRSETASHLTILPAVEVTRDCLPGLRRTQDSSPGPEAPDGSSGWPAELRQDHPF